MTPFILAALLTLTTPRLEVAIDDATGALVSITDRSDGTRLVEKSSDRYALQHAPTEEVVATEAEDRVIERHGDTFVCENPKLPGLRIEKSWRIEGRWLTKRVAFSTDSTDLGLLKYSTATTAAPGFYRDGYLNDPARHPVEYPYIFTKDLTTERHITDSHSVADHHYAIFTNPRLGRGLAQYRFKVDDRFVHPLSSYSFEPGLYYGPTGWRIAVAAQWLTKGRSLSADVRWHLFDGDHIAFHKEFIALPEFAAQWAFESPAWVKQARATGAWAFAESSPRLAPYKKQADAMGEGYLMVLMGGVFCNTRNYLADPIITPSGVPLRAAELRRIVDEFHSLSPRIKVGPITWQWGFGEMDPVFHDHPEWTVHDPDGQPAFAATGWSSEKVFSQLLTPACRDYDLEQYRGMVKRYDFDFVYMDTGQGGVTRFDWTTRQCAQDYDWADLYKGIRDAARGNRNGAVFFNGTPRLYSSFCDCGYFEGLGFVKARDWRAVADRVLLVKLYQPGDKWTTPLYWNADYSQPYANYCLALALLPGNFLSGVGATRWPIVAAACELRDARLATEANPRPCWWKDKTDIELCALRFPGGALLSAINHGKGADNARLSCDLGPFGFDPARPVHVWLFRPRPTEQIQKETVVTESEANQIFAQEGNATHRAVEASFIRSFDGGMKTFEETVPLEPGIVRLVMLTQSPTLAYAVDGRPTHFLLPPPAGAKAETVPADRPLAPEIVARREGYVLPEGRRSVSLIPERSSPKTVRQVEKDVNKEIAGIRVRRTLVLSCEHNEENQAHADADSLALRADMGQQKVAGFASAGIEADHLGAMQLALKMKKPMYGRYTAATNSLCFAGLVVDYHTAKGYTRRVLFPLVPHGAGVLQNARPWWGVFTTEGGAEPAYLIPVQLAETVSLDLGPYAPEGWDGRVLFGVALDSCGLDAGIEARIVRNGPPGPRLAKMPGLPPAPRAEKALGYFQGVNIFKFEDGAKMEGESVSLPARGLIEATGLGVATWKVRRAADSKSAELWINYQVEGGSYQLTKVPLADKVAPGGELKFDVDLKQHAPKGWSGRCRVRLVGNGVTAELIANSSFQIY